MYTVTAWGVCFGAGVDSTTGGVEGARSEVVTVGAGAGADVVTVGAGAEVTTEGVEGATVGVEVDAG